MSQHYAPPATPSVTIRPAEMSDVSETWVRWLNDPKVTQYSKQRLKTHTLDSQSAFLSQRLLDESRVVYLAFLYGTHIGTGEILYIRNSDEGACAEVSYMIGERCCWGKGIGRQLVNLLCKEAFKNKNIRKVQAGAHRENIGSHKVLLSNGFKISKERNSDTYFILDREDFI
ncbi:MAG: GNAT family N-acetyltransferase [Rhodospirillales bacterium]|nr:GNAT family N-acetyltransferase [Rhodospirillales bacterium]